MILYDYVVMVLFKTSLYMQSKGDSEIEIDRSTSWSCARKDKNGNFTDDVKKIVLEIVSCSFML